MMQEWRQLKVECPKCGRPVVSRSNPLCAFCGERLPAELLFTAEERKAVAEEIAELRRRMKVPLAEPSEPGGGIMI